MNIRNRILFSDREYLERYLIYNKGSIERAKKHFDKVCTLRNLMPDFLQGYDIRNEFLALFNCGFVVYSQHQKLMTHSDF